MIMWIFSAIVYIFFIYGVIEFLRKAYLDFGIKHVGQGKHKIQILVNDCEEIEHIIRKLKKSFTHVVIILREDNEEARKIAQALSKDITIEIVKLEDLSKVKKSE